MGKQLSVVGANKWIKAVSISAEGHLPFSFFFLIILFIISFVFDPLLKHTRNRIYRLSFLIAPCTVFASIQDTLTHGPVQ